MDQAQNVTANFQEEFHLSVALGVPGTGTPFNGASVTLQVDPVFGKTYAALPNAAVYTNNLSIPAGATATITVTFTFFDPSTPVLWVRRGTSARALRATPARSPWTAARPFPWASVSASNKELRAPGNWGGAGACRYRAQARALMIMGLSTVRGHRGVPCLLCHHACWSPSGCGTAGRSAF